MLKEMLNAEPDKSKWPAIKVREIHKAIPSVARVVRPDFDVEIVRTRDMGGGVLETHVRAWQGGKRVGFGVDGSCDMERIRLHNPPIFVRDDTSTDLQRSYYDEVNDITYNWAYREDVYEAMLQRIEHIISIAPNKVVGSQNIVNGKVGRSIDNFPPSLDGYCGIQRSGATEQIAWDAVHDATASDSVDTTSTTFRAGNYNAATNNIGMYRGFIYFDTASLGSDTINSATFSAKCQAKTANNPNDGLDYYNIVEATPASDTALAVGDYDQCGAVNNPTLLCDTSKDFDAFTVDAVASWTLNAAGLAAINGSGKTTIGMREGHDITDTPTSGAAGEGQQLRFYTSEQGTADDPDLSVDHTASTAYEQESFRFRNDAGAL